APRPTVLQLHPRRRRPPRRPARPPPPSPTRRSSDLIDAVIATTTFLRSPLTEGNTDPEDPEVRPLADSFRSLSSKLDRAWAQERSEEHTSELQSRFDLVCRLLLEKKRHRERSGAQAV